MAKRGSYRHGVTERVLRFMTTNADRPVSLNELVEATGDKRASISGQLGRSKETYPNLTSPSKGIWVWHSKLPEPEPEVKAPEVQEELMMIRVIGRKPTDAGHKFLVMDTTTFMVYTMQEVTW